eukprot:TRINITY_DN12376_c0_g1_i4.p1 TRINITY_DN12376_c0_g1~~TRINITY_DN12376_c0_g1_i4.p1  ORF type:complete len:190 (+),score=27.86 TRINITY_DN12376_c0_g1_i4:102-671(+)
MARSAWRSGRSTAGSCYSRDCVTTHRAILEVTHTADLGVHSLLDLGGGFGVGLFALWFGQVLCGLYLASQDFFARWGSVLGLGVVTALCCIAYPDPRVTLTSYRDVLAMSGFHVGFQAGLVLQAHPLQQQLLVGMLLFVGAQLLDTPDQDQKNAACHTKRFVQKANLAVWLVLSATVQQEVSEYLFDRF